MFRDIFSNKNIMAISITSAFWSFMRQGNNLFWALYLKEYFGVSVTNIGIFLMISQTESLSFQLPEGLIAGRYGREKLILFGTVLRTFGPVLYFLAPS